MEEPCRRAFYDLHPCGGCKKGGCKKCGKNKRIRVKTGMFSFLLRALFENKGF